MINILIYLLVVGVIIGLVWYVCDALPVPHPLNKIIKIVSVVVGCIIIIYALLGITGVDLTPRRLP